MTRTELAVGLYSVGLLAEVGGIVLVVVDLMSSRKAVNEWDAANPRGDAGGSVLQVLMLDQMMRGLLSVTPRRIVAVGLLVVGVVAGGIGNFVSLGS